MRTSIFALTLLSIIRQHSPQQPATQPATRAGRVPTTQYRYPVDPDSRPREGVPQGRSRGPDDLQEQDF